MWVAGGIATQFLSIWALRHARRRQPLLLGGLALFALSVAMIATGLGAELGMAWALTTISVVAYALILPPFFRARAIGHDRRPARLKKMPAPPSGSKARLALRLFSAGPLYLVAALALSLLIATKPWADEITRLFTGGLTTPLFWSIGALHATVDTDLKRIIWLPVLLVLAAIGGYILL